MKLNSIKIWLKQRLLFLLGLALLLILLQLINSLTAGGLLYFGLVPRSSHGLIGIFVLHLFTAVGGISSAIYHRYLL